MALLKKTHMTLGIAAAIATILTLFLTVYTMFFPERINDVTSAITGVAERTPAGTIRAEYVGSQIQVFLYASLVGILLAAAGLGTAYHWSSAQSAGSVARGRGKIRWLKIVLVSFPAVLVLLFAVYLPRAVFQPTNEEELGRQFFLGAWAVRSLLGGLVLGVTYVLAACLIAYLGFVLFVQVPRSLKLSRYQRQLET
jgi:hypothetical protein